MGEKWNILDKSQCGAIGKVWGGRQKVSRASDGFICMRTVLTYDTIAEIELERFKKEYEMLMSVRNRFVVDHYWWNHFRDAKTFLWMCENVERPALSTYIAAHHERGELISEQTIWEIISMLADGLFACHNRQSTPSTNSWNAKGPPPTSDYSAAVIHGEIRPKNILFDQNRGVKLINFRLRGLQAVIKANCGIERSTQAYTAPEVLSGQHPTPAADIWSLGCVVFELCMLSKVFKDATNEREICNTIRLGFDWPAVLPYSATLRLFVEGCLKLQPTERPTVTRILEVSQVVSIRRLFQNTGIGAELREKNATLERRLLEMDKEQAKLTGKIRELEIKLMMKEREIQHLKAE